MGKSNELNVVCDRTHLRDALKVVSHSVVGKNATIPILSCVYVEAKKRSMKLLGTNLDMEIETSIDAEAGRGRAAIPLALLRHFLSIMPDDEVRLGIDKEKRIQLQAGRATVNVTPFPFEDFPLPQPWPEKPDFSVRLAADQLGGLLKAPAHSMSTEETLSEWRVSHDR